MLSELLKEKKLDRDGLAIEILDALNQLPPQLREVFVLAHYRNASPEEIAARLNLDPTEASELQKRAGDLFLQMLGPTRVE